MQRSKRHRFAFLALLMSIALVAAACSSSSGDTNVRDFGEIQSSDFEFTVDAGGVARMQVTTNIEAVCSIAWGETDALGTIGTDLDMAGGAHNRHEVVLVGAEPGKTYSFRVQGATADGALYQSPISTFTLPEAPSGGGVGMGDHGENIARGARVVEVSSTFSAAWSGENAVDGDMSSEWATKGNGDDAYIEIDLGSQRQVIGVEFITRTMGDGTATTTEYTVTVDGGETLGPFPAGDPSDTRFADAVFTGRVLRFEVVSSTGGNTGAIEVRAFAPSDS